MPSRSDRPAKPLDGFPARRVPIAMSLALEVVAELRARERATAQRLLNELLGQPPPPPKRS
jgi:hypothetical protein